MLPDKINIQTAQLPTSYENAKQALADCSSLDECKDWSDKAGALASYAKQADDDDLERYAIRIKARAIRRCGELLKKFDGKGARTDKPSEGNHPRSAGEAAQSAGMSEHQHKQAVRVANVPADAFDEAVEGDEKVTITGLAERGKKPAPINPYPDAPDAPKGFAKATQAMGSVRRFSEFCEEHDPVFVAGGVLDYEVAAVTEQVKLVDNWLDKFVVNLGGSK
jgi:hypothetical protein